MMEEKEKTGKEKGKPEIVQNFPTGLPSLYYENELGTLSIVAENSEYLHSILCVVAQAPKVAKMFGFKNIGENFEEKNNTVT